MRATNRLNASRLGKLPAGLHCDGAGLWLVKRIDGGGQWVLRYTIWGKRREMGLGGFQDVGLAEARRAAEKWRGIAKSGRDPVKERAKERSAAIGATLNDIAPLAFEAKKTELKGAGEAGRWMSPINTHVLPKLGRMPIAEIDQDDVVRMLKPLWHDSPDVGKKAASRLGYILRWAKAKKYLVDENAVEAAKVILGKQPTKRSGIAAMPWREVPDFYAELAKDDSLGSYALRLTILTTMRSQTIRLLTPDQIDREAMVWNCPIAHMKGKEATPDGMTHFRTPLPQMALDLIEEAAAKHAKGAIIFPNQRSTEKAPRPASDMLMTRLLNRRGIKYRPHGFRASFKTWSLEHTDHIQERVEWCLAHATGTQVERAYMRGEFLDLRRPILQDWADWVTSKC